MPEMGSISTETRCPRHVRYFPVKTGANYDNRFVSIVFIEKRKIVRWRDYMDSLAAWTALTSGA